MAAHPAPATRRRAPEMTRLVLGSLLEMAVKAYGASAVAAVALSDAETTGGKARDAVAAVPTLSEEYRRAKYVSEHREEIQSALDYLSTHQVPQEELQASIDESSRTLDQIDTTYAEIDQAQASGSAFGSSLTDDLNPADALPYARDGFDHVRGAWEAKPSLESIQQLQEVAQQAGPLMDQASVLAPVYYTGGLAVADNFASDEIASTLAVMALSLVLAFLVGRSLGFWVRRGRPGLIAFVLHGLGARVFHRWYARNAAYSMSRPLYDNTRAQVQRELVDDPEAALDEESFQRLEAYFAERGA